MIRLQEYPNNRRYKVYWENDKYLGTFVLDVDGFYYYWPNGAIELIKI